MTPIAITRGAARLQYCLLLGGALALGACRAERAAAQDNFRVGDPARATFSDFALSQQDLRGETPVRDSLQRLSTATSAAALWSTVTASLDGSGLPYAQAALLRLADLRDPAHIDSAAALLARLRSRAVPGLAARSLDTCNPECLAGELAPLLEVVVLERERVSRGDAAVLATLLARVTTRDERLGDVTALSRLGAAATDSLLARFEVAPARTRQKYLVRLSAIPDPRLIPTFAQAYLHPDSLGLTPQVQGVAVRGLAWIGTRASLVALRDARAQALALGVYDTLATQRVDLWMRQLTGSTVDELVARLPEGGVVVQLDAEVRPSQWSTAFRQTGNAPQGNVAVYVGVPVGAGTLDDVVIASLRLAGPDGGALAPTSTRIQRNGDRRFPAGYVELVFDHEAAVALVPATAATGTLVPLTVSGSLANGRALRAEALVRMVGP